MADSRTVNCVDCMAAPAKGYCGNVVDAATKERILAGWCDACWQTGDGGFVTTSPNRLKIQVGGYVRPWQPAMGKEKCRPETNID